MKTERRKRQIQQKIEIGRRRALTVFGHGMSGVLVGCAGDGSFGFDLSDAGAGGSDDGGFDGGTRRADAGAGDSDAGQADAGAWAIGGTAAMTAKSSYPDPFASGLGSVCELTCAATLGPCYAQTVNRQDISEGQPGLPMRMALLIVDETCRPVPNASVDVWHTAASGLYSGSDASDMCTLGDNTARQSRWFRGVQMTDARGRVDFDSCFPGWYRSRTVHIHFTIRVDGTELVTSQLVFDDALVDDIVATQPIYKDRGSRDTKNSNDNVVSAASAPSYSFQTRRMPDGAMLAWKTIVLRSSTGASLCGMGGRGPGGR